MRKGGWAAPDGGGGGGSGEQRRRPPLVSGAWGMAISRRWMPQATRTACGRSCERPAHTSWRAAAGDLTAMRRRFQGVLLGQMNNKKTCRRPQIKPARW